MIMRSLIVVLLLGSPIFCDKQQQFPEGFKFGVATSSYQVEGAWNVNGKGENIWDRITHTNPGIIIDKSNGDVACDTYHQTSTDVQLLKNLSVSFYRFSISWSRVLPSGFSNVINPDGIRYYNELIDTLLKNGIEPMVTIFHADLPQPLQDLGGLANPDLVDIFLDYAKVLFAKFGDRVKRWITFNEPQSYCPGFYEGTGSLFILGSAGIGTYLCGHTLLRAHAKVYRFYEKTYKLKQRGQVGITLTTNWFEPNSTRRADVAAATRMIQFQFGWFAHPIFSLEGDYPKIMRDRVARMSAEENFPRSRLPTFTKAEISALRGSADFFGFNHYTTSICAPGSSNRRPSQQADVGVSCWQKSSWETAKSPWLKVVPWGFRKILNWIKQQYNNPEVIITENGFSDEGDLMDCRRINYHNKYLEELLDAIYKDGCNITGYTAWSFMDNFEWIAGYTARFGLLKVDFNDTRRKRTLKMSAYTYRNIIETRKIDWDYQPGGFDKCKFK